MAANFNVGVRDQPTAQEDGQQLVTGQRWADDPGRLLAQGTGTIGTWANMQGYGFQPAPYNPAQTRHEWFRFRRVLPGRPSASPAELDVDAGRSRMRYPYQRTAEVRDIMSLRAAVITQSCPDSRDRRFMPNGEVQDINIPTHYALEIPRYNLNQVDEASLLQAARARVTAALARNG